MDLFGFGKKRKIQENRLRLEKLASELIQNYENNCASLCPSSEQDLLLSFRDVLDKASEGLAKLESDFDWDRYVNSWLCRISFDFLASGRYHLYRGVLNPQSCADKMMEVYKHCMMFAVKRGEIPQEEMDDQLDYLHECIAAVG